MENAFKFYLPLSKGTNDTLTGIASTLSVDRDGERMSDNALKEMADEIIRNGVNLFSNHEHQWQNTLGVVKNAKVENNQLKIGIFLDDPNINPQVTQLLTKMKRGIKLGLSVGGTVTKERFELDKSTNRKVKVIDGVKLFEISVVGIPSNSDSFMSLPQAIGKSMKKGRRNLADIFAETNEVDEAFVSRAKKEGYNTEEIRRWISENGLDVKSIKVEKKVRNIHYLNIISGQLFGKPYDQITDPSQEKKIIEEYDRRYSDEEEFREKCPCCLSLLKGNKCEICFYKFSDPKVEKIMNKIAELEDKKEKIDDEIAKLEDELDKLYIVEQRRESK